MSGSQIAERLGWPRHGFERSATTEATRREKDRPPVEGEAQSVSESIHVGQPFDAPSEHGLLMACGRTTVMNALIVEARRMALSKGRRPASKGMCVVYFLRLRSGAFYIGVSEDLEGRLEDHSLGRACRTTHLDPPASFIRLEVYSTFSDARRREAQLKRWSRAKKEAFVAGDITTLHALS